MQELNSQALERVSNKIKELRLEEISLFFLESHRPLANIIAHLAYLVPPVIGKQYLELLKDKNSIELLIHRLKN